MTNDRQLSHLINRMSGGQSCPWLCMCQGEHDRSIIKAVVKFRNPITESTHAWDTSTSSIAEYITALICKKLDLPIPEFGILHIADEDVEFAKPDHKELLRRNVGANFYTVYMSNFKPYVPGRDNITSNDFGNIVTLDSVILNFDRKAGNPNILSWKSKWLLIDHALAMHVSLYERDYNVREFTKPLIDHKYFKDHVSFGILRTQRLTGNLYVTWRGLITESWINEVWETLPQQWVIGNRFAEVMKRYLLERPQAFAGLEQKLTMALQ